MQTPWDAFPEEARQDVEGLTWIGHLEDHFSFAGHDFSIRTLRGEEELLAALVTKEFAETLGQTKAHMWSIVALALVAVDGDSEFCPPASPNRVDQATARLRWASGQWYWPTCVVIFGHYTDLLQRQQEAVDALEDFCKRSLSSPTPGADSLTDKASWVAPQEDIRDYLDPED